MIEVNALSVRFGGVVALDALTFDAAEDVVGLIGPNGAGKTTLINALSGFVSVASGSIRMDGHELVGVAPHERSRSGLARSFQKAQIVEDLSVGNHLRAVLDACLRGQGRSQRDTLIDKALQCTGIRELVNVRGSALNSFQRRMTEIARCLVAKPRLVLLDEPAGGLSASEIQHLRGVINSIRAEYDAQVLLVDHDVELIRDVCESTVVLDFGKLIASGPTNDVLQDGAVKAAYLGR